MLGILLGKFPQRRQVGPRGAPAQQRVALLGQLQERSHRRPRRVLQHGRKKNHRRLVSEPADKSGQGGAGAMKHHSLIFSLCVIEITHTRAIEGRSNPGFIRL